MNQRSALRLATGQLLPDLRIIATEEVFVHEDHDPVRVDRLVASLRDDGVLRNPPVAAPLSGGGYVVLDGANRAAALASIGIG
ncbi:MAG: ParB N-terminal domain-containing protein, partial [bacterium]